MDINLSKQVSSLGDSILSDKNINADSSSKERKCQVAMNNWYMAMNNFAAAAAAQHHMHHHSFFHHLSTLSFMNHLNFKPMESNHMKISEKAQEQVNANMKPSSFLSAKSKKIGGFLNLSTEKKGNSGSEAS